METAKFESDDPAQRGEMTISYTLADAAGGTQLVAMHDGLPPGASAEDSETSWRMSLDKLAAVPGRN